MRFASPWLLFPATEKDKRVTISRMCLITLHVKSNLVCSFPSPCTPKWTQTANTSVAFPCHFHLDC